MVRTILSLTGIISLCFFLFAGEVVYQNNSGGLNSKSSPVFIDDSEATDLQNINLDTDGAIAKRNGYTVLNTTLLQDQVDGLGTYRKVDGSLFMIAAAAKLYKMDDFDGTWDDITGTTTITTENPVNFEVFEDTLIATNGQDKVQEWDGTGVATDNDCDTDISLTKAKYVEQFKNRLFLANVTVSGTDYPSRAYFSDITDKDAWTTDSFIQIGIDDGEVITGMVHFADRLYFLKDNSIYRVRSTGDFDVPFSIEKTFATEGCIAPGSVQVFNNVIMAYSNKGFILFDGSRSEVISDKIRPTLDGLDRNNIINGKSGVFENLNQYWFSVADGDSGDCIIVYDYHNDAFLLHKGMSFNAMLSILDSSNEERFYAGDFAGYVYRQDQGTDDYPLNVKTAIDAFYQTRNYTFDSYLFTKKAVHVVVLYEYQDNATLNMNYTYDLSTQDWKLETLDQTPPGAKWDIAQWDIDVFSDTGASFHRFDLLSQGMALRLKFSNNTLGEQFKIYGWSIGYDEGSIIFNP